MLHGQTPAACTAPGTGLADYAALGRKGSGCSKPEGTLWVGKFDATGKLPSAGFVEILPGSRRGLFCRGPLSDKRRGARTEIKSSQLEFCQAPAGKGEGAESTWHSNRGGIRLGRFKFEFRLEWVGNS